jgi:hypothetical protein
MTQRVIFGIDPGLSGAIAVLHDGRFVDVIDMPTVGRGKKGRLTTDGSQVAEFIRSHTADINGAHVHAVMEETQSMPGQGRSAAHNYGRTAGIVIGVLCALRISRSFVTPQKWKKQMGLSSDKEASRGAAIDRFPDAPLARKRDEGRAEALLLAHWCMRFEGWTVE